MALIVENGTGLTNSEAYCSVAYADNYHAIRGNTLWATMSDTEKEQAIRRAADYMVQVYRPQWAGYRVYASQALDWPRTDVILEDAQTGQVYINSNIVPDDIAKANAALAFIAAHGEMLPDQTGQNVIRKKVDALEIEYDKNSPSYPRYKAVMSLLAPYFSGTSSSSTVSRVYRA